MKCARDGDSGRREEGAVGVGRGSRATYREGDLVEVIGNLKAGEQVLRRATDEIRVRDDDSGRREEGAVGILNYSC
jgi:hypothetical protein